MPAHSISFEELAKRLEAVAEVAGAQGAISVLDPQVARYARVLEYGSVAGQRPWPRPGPRTTLAVDPESGAQVVVSVQAPQGFIRSQAPQFASLLAEELRAPADWLDAEAVSSHVARAMGQSLARAAEAVRAAVPRESGRLAESIEVLSQ